VIFVPDIGKRIKEKRIELGITQEDLASKLGYKSKTTIAKIENGTNDITQSRVVDFANALNTTPAYLMGWEDSESQSIPILNKKDERDIAKRLEQTLDQLESDQDGLMFSGEPLDDQTRELLKASLQNSITIAKINAKQKFTPKKYRDKK
jgi:transcriptional regulator with XRE-family HTH domain